MRILRLLCLAALAAGALAGPPAAALASRAVVASAAPRYVASEPSDGAEVHESPAEVVIRFSEPLGEGSRLSVRDECGERLDAGKVEITLNEMRVGLAEGRSGVHSVRYRAAGIGGLTGSTEGGFSYRVHTGPSCRRDGGGHGGHGGAGGHGNHHGSIEDDTRQGLHQQQHTHPPHGAPGTHAAGGGSGHARGNHAGHRPRFGGAGTGRQGRNHDGHGEPLPLAAGEDGAESQKAGDRHLAGNAEPVPSPGAGAAVAALLASVVVGALGGWILRANAARS